MHNFIILNCSIFNFLFLFNLLLFFVGLYGFLFCSTHYIYLIICNEIILFALILQLLLCGLIYDSIIPQIFVLFILLFSSAEVVIVFSILIRFFRLTGIVYIKPVYYILPPNNTKKNGN